MYICMYIFFKITSVKLNYLFKALRCKLKSSKCSQRLGQYQTNFNPLLKYNESKEQYEGHQDYKRKSLIFRYHHFVFTQQFNRVERTYSSCKFVAKNEIIVRVIQPQERQHILNFIRLHYFLEEPLTAFSEPKQQDKEDEEWSVSHLEQGMSFLAILKGNNNSGKKIVGVLISGSKGPDEAELLFEEAAKFGPSKLGHILQFTACMERDANVYKRFNVQKVVHIHVLAVDKEMRGQNIGHTLVDEFLIRAKFLNYELVTVDCTSFYSASLFQRMGFQCVNIKYYKDYIDESGKQVFKPDPPHECVKTFALKLKTIQN